MKCRICREAHSPHRYISVHHTNRSRHLCFSQHQWIFGIICLVTQLTCLEDRAISAIHPDNLCIVCQMSGTETLQEDSLHISKCTHVQVEDGEYERRNSGMLHSPGMHQSKCKIGLCPRLNVEFTKFRSRHHPIMSCIMFIVRGCVGD